MNGKLTLFKTNIIYGALPRNMIFVWFLRRLCL
jgi:hypothetical protein